jgi:hypothetical protein
MNMFDLFIAYVSWGSEGKKRPVLIFEQAENTVTVFNITTQYENKSESVRRKFFKIDDWAQAGLNKQSYVDTNRTITLPLSSVDADNPIGTLTEHDIDRLIEFTDLLKE